MFDNKCNIRIVLTGLILVLLVAAGTAIALAQTPDETPMAEITAEAEDAPSGIPTIPHPVAGYEDCLSCHVEATSAGEVSAAEAPDIPHEIAGLEQCNMCHSNEAEGIEGVPEKPADHEGRPENICMGCHAPTTDEESTLPPLPEEASTEFCLSCHGPYDNLIAQTVDAIEARGVEANPHQYVPHNSQNITSCDACHEVHELPVTASTEFPELDTKRLSCFSSSCHHERDFTPCSECHED